MTQVLRYRAFPDGDTGGNPAGVVLDATGMSDAEMQRTAAEVGYSETAFLLPNRTIRYFTPAVEVPFCGHATIATGVAYAQRHGPGRLDLRAQAGAVAVVTRVEQGSVVATLTSITPRVLPLADDIVAELLAALHWTPADLDPALPVRVASAGAFHPVVATRARARLAALDVDLPALAALQRTHDWLSAQVVWRADATTVWSRNAAPGVGVDEDPATGSAAAALGGYLRAEGLVVPPARVTVLQGHDMGAPSRLLVDIPAGDGGIDVSGTAIAM